MIAISTQIANTSGFVTVDQVVESTAESKTARVQRTKLLDGTVSIVHYGVSDGDRSINISGYLDKEDAEKLQTIFDNETFVNLSAADGFYDAVIADFTNDSGNIKMTIYIKGRV